MVSKTSKFVQCCVRYDTCVHLISCCLMTVIQLNSLNSRPLLYNVLDLPPSKLIPVFNFSSTFGSWRFSFFHTKLLNCEPYDKFMEILWLLLISAPCLAGRSAWGPSRFVPFIPTLSEFFLFSFAKLNYLLHPLLYFQRLFTVIFGKVSLFLPALPSTSNHTPFMISRLISHLCASVGCSPRYHGRQHSGRITWYARPQFPCWWRNYWLLSSVWLTRMSNFIKNEWH